VRFFRLLDRVVQVVAARRILEEEQPSKDAQT
jgi:hypothetical protein